MNTRSKQTNTKDETIATVELPSETVATVDDRAAGRRLSDPETIREIALEYVDRVEVLTESGEPIGEALARDNLSK